MRIALVGPAIPKDIVGDLTAGPVGYGGVAVNALARGLDKLGHSVTTVTGSTDIDETWEHQSGRLRIVVVPFRQSPRDRLRTQYALESRRMTNVLKDLESDVTHAHWTYEFALAALRSDRYAIVTARDLPWEELRIERRPGLVIRYAMALRVRRLVRNLTANSAYTARGWRRQMLYHDPIPVVPNPVAFPEGWTFASHLIDSPSSSAIRALCISNTGSAKNVPDLLRAWPAIHSGFDGSVLHLVGASLTPRFVKESLGYLPPSIEFHGHQERSEVFSLIDSSDVLLHPSIQETIGNPVIEAMSRGLPVVADRRCSAVSSILGNGDRGALASFAEPKQVLRAVHEATDDSVAARDRRMRALHYSEAEFSPESVAKRWTAIYEKVAESSRR